MVVLPSAEAFSLAMLRTMARNKPCPTFFIAVFNNTNRKMKLVFFFSQFQSTEKNLEMKVDIDVTRIAISFVGRKKMLTEEIN